MHGCDLLEHKNSAVIISVWPACVAAILMNVIEAVELHLFSSAEILCSIKPALSTFASHMLATVAGLCIGRR